MTMNSEQGHAIRDGFVGQRMLVLLRSRVRQYLQMPGSTKFVVSDCGYFPHADHHGVTRNQGISQGIIIISASGSGWCRTEAGRFDVAPGQAVLIPPHAPHAYGADPDDPWTLWWLHIAGPEVSELFKSAGLSTSAPVRTLSDVYRSVGLVQEALEWTQRDSSTMSLMAASAAALHLLAIVSSDRASGDKTTEGVEQAANYLRSNPTERISVADLAMMSRLSPSHFSALFKKHTGSSVLQYQKLLRMARARELLHTTTLPVADVGHAAGFSDPFYFARQFKQVHDVSPRQYRQSSEHVSRRSV
jgi:AraC family transcriptional regulator of arabinose operon